MTLYILSRCSWTLYNFRRALAQEAIKQGFDVSVLGQGGDGYDIKLQEADIPFSSIPISRKGIDPLRDIWLIISLVRIFRREKPSLIHNFTIKPAIYGTLAAAVAGVPARVVTITGLGHAFTTGAGWLRWGVERLYRMALRQADVVYFQNADDLHLFQERRLVQPEKARLVAGSGVDLKRFSLQPLPSSCGSAPVFIMVARLLREKGVREYVAAAHLVKERYSDARFLLVGGIDGRNPSALSAEEFDGLNYGQAVEWLGEVEDVRPAIAEADVAVLPSYREGTPRSLLEGAAMGRAIITTDAVGCREAVRDKVTGLMVPTMNTKALAEAMIYLIDHPSEIVKMGRSGRNLIETCFDERSVIRQTLDCYRELLDKKLAP